MSNFGFYLCVWSKRSIIWWRYTYTCELLHRVIILWRTKSFLILLTWRWLIDGFIRIRIYFFLTIQQRVYIIIIIIIVYYLKIILYHEKILFLFDQTVQVPKRVTLKSTMTLLLQYNREMRSGGIRARCSIYSVQIVISALSYYLSPCSNAEIILRICLGFVHCVWSFTTYKSIFGFWCASYLNKIIWSELEATT